MRRSIRLALVTRSARLALLAVLVGSAAVTAKPMPPATDEAALAFGAVVSAEYLDRDTSVTPSYFGGALVRYRLLAAHKNSAVRIGSPLRVRYVFHDTSPCVEETGWKFSEEMMPKRGSRWLLFLGHDPQSDTYHSYRGAVGRWPLTDENLARLKQLQEKAAKQ